MGGVLGGDPDDSQVELPAFTSAGTPFGEGESPLPFDSASFEFLLTVPWYYKFIESWSRVHFYVAVGFAAGSLAVLGFLLLSAILAGRVLSPSITALIIGCFGAIAFLLLSLPATVLVILLVDLARNVRLLIQQTVRTPAGAIDPAGQSRTSLSHPVG